MIFDSVKSRYRRFKYRNEHQHPGRVLAAEIALNGGLLLLFLGVIGLIIMLV